MYSILVGSLLLSLLHAVIPSHWLPVLAVGKKENWTINEVTKVTFLAGFAHALSTIIIGVIIGLLGLKLTESVQNFSHIVAEMEACFDKKHCSNLTTSHSSMPYRCCKQISLVADKDSGDMRNFKDCFRVYDNKNICVSGIIKEYKSKPELIITGLKDNSIQ
ncbi:MAG TPA: hypothetical protein VLM16_08990 [Ginsengibacter sp.]|nr:hypothetical protein [Ginsengibacter sp.]